MNSKIIFILGPTASGKSDLAIKIAQTTQSFILNADSVQVYEGLEIGSSAPTREEKDMAPHFLYGFVKRGENSTAAHHLQAVRSTLQVQAEQKRWILCGGSGFYLQAIEKGMEPFSDTPPEIKKEVESFIEQKGWVEAHAQVAKVHGDKIHLNDHYRIQRALEVMELRRQNLHQNDVEYVASPLKEFHKLKVGLRADKEILQKRVLLRVEKMLRNGFVEEVKGLMDAGFDDWAPLQSVGYFEVREFLKGRLSKEQLVEKITISNMQLIKKQMTWFKRDSEICWFDISEVEKAYAYAKEWMFERVLDT